MRIIRTCYKATRVRSTKISINNSMQISFYIQFECSTSFHSKTHVLNKWSKCIGTDYYEWVTFEGHHPPHKHVFTNICSTANVFVYLYCICDPVTDYSKETVATEQPQWFVEEKKHSWLNISIVLELTWPSAIIMFSFLFSAFHYSNFYSNF